MPEDAELPLLAKLLPLAPFVCPFDAKPLLVDPKSPPPLPPELNPLLLTAPNPFDDTLDELEPKPLLFAEILAVADPKPFWLLTLDVTVPKPFATALPFPFAVATGAATNGAAVGRIAALSSELSSNGNTNGCFESPPPELCCTDVDTNWAPLPPNWLDDTKALCCPFLPPVDTDDTTPSNDPREPACNCGLLYEK